MKKILTLLAMALMAVGTNAQSLIAEVDWTQQTEYYDLWYDWDRCTITVNGEGLVIESYPPEDAEYWHPQAPMIGYIPDIVEGKYYQVKFTLNAPSAGEIRLDFADQGGGATSPCIINVEAGEKEYVVDFPNYPADCAYALIYYQCGKIPGTHIIKKVQVLAASASEWTIAGDKDLLGADWDATYNDNTMKTFDGENHILLKTNLKLSEGTYQFKACKNGESYPAEGNASLVIDKDGYYNVTFTFNSETKELSTHAEETEIISYNYDAENKVAEVKEISNTFRGDVIIPSTVVYEGQTYTVTRIGDAAAYGKFIASVSIPNTVTYIGSQAFRFCSNMTTVSIPSSVTFIGEYAFYGCSSLTSVELPDELTSIETYSFQNCSSLTSVRIPDKVTTVSFYAFSGCSAIESVTIGNSVSEIYDGAFGSCPSLSDVYCIAENVPNAYPSSFGWNEAQLTLHVPTALVSDYKGVEPWMNFGNIEGISAVNDGNTFQATVGKTTFKVKVLSAADKTCQIGADGRGDAIVSGRKDWDGVIPSKVIGSDYEEYTVIGIGNRAFLEEDGIKDLTLPETLQQISEGAFMRCHELMYVTIPAGVKTVGGYLFNGQESLTEVVSMIEDPDAINGISIDCGGRYGNKATLVVPAGTKSIYENANGWNHFPRIVEMNTGDADGNTYVDQNDVEITKDFIISSQKPDNFVRKNADTNGDKKVNVIDIVNILNTIKSTNQ